MKADTTVALDTNSIRIRLTKDNGRSMLVGGFITLLGAARLATDLAQDKSIMMVSVEAKHPYRGWRQVWTRWTEPGR